SGLWLLILSALVIVVPGTGNAQGLKGFGSDTPQLLDPAEAFAPVVDSADATAITVTYTIAEGYYLYRKSLNAIADDERIAISGMQLPDGMIVKDDYFGDSEVYRDQVTMTLAYQNPADLQTVDLILGSQGCADIGVCYPPQEQRLTATPETTTVAAVKADPGASTAISAVAATGSSPVTSTPVLGIDALLSNDSEELLPPEIAFVPSVSSSGADSVRIRFDIEPGYYLYRDKFAVRGNDPAVQVTALDISAGKSKEDAFFGLVDVHYGEAILDVRLAAATGGELLLDLDYQGCADIGVCFPPQTTQLPVSMAAVGTVVAAAAGSSTPSAALISAQPSSSVPAVSEQQGLANTLSTSSLWWIVITFFGLGLLLSFTPCVFPMIPILSSLIVGQGGEITTRRAFLLSLCYVLAMAVTYTIAGVLVGLSGQNFQIWFQNPWVLSAFAFLFVLLSLSMFGFYELQMPAAIQNRLNNLSDKAETGTYLGAGVMGVLSALIVGPCVTAPLVGALIFIADTGDAFIGGTALFALGMGMGAPLILIGASCGKLLPSSGPWMDTTKSVFGVLMLAMAIWMLSRFVPGGVTLALSAALVIVSGIYLGALDTINPDSSGWRRLSKGFGLIALFYGAILLIGAASGGRDLLQPLKGIVTAGSGEHSEEADELAFQRIKSVADLDAAVARAHQNQQAVMLDFYADWCISCIEMEKFTFTDPGVQQRLESVVLLQADVTKNDAEDKALLKRFRLFGPPAILFFTPEAGEMTSAQVVGFMPADDFSQHLDTVLN
ncbi:MAG: protein-disulfide reductase DsbD, partial [Gammaproteobacteria bacterium]|nr:protein-disulfide reductase DsbD [Gammaproteobacteria bacterium]